MVQKLLGTVLGLCLVAAAAPAMAGGPSNDAEAFALLKGLEGTWDAETPGGQGTIRYRVASADSIVIAEMFPGTDHEMITVYHMDGDELVATHYCAAGNQPRFKLDPSTSTADTLSFGFNGGTNMKPNDGHIHQGAVRRVDSDHVEEEWWFWKDGKPAHSTKFRLTRRVTE